MTDLVELLARRLSNKIKRVHDLSGVGYIDDVDCIEAAALLRSQATEIERLKDKVDGLESDLQNAVETAFHRGAEDWTRMNYPTEYARLVAARDQGGE